MKKMNGVKRRILKIKHGKLEVEDIADRGKKTEQDREKFIRGLGIATELGFTISLPMVGGIFLGIFLDGKFSSFPRLTLSLLFLGVIVAFTNLFWVIGEYLKKNK